MAGSALRRGRLRPSIRILIFQRSIVLRAISDPGAHQSEPRDLTAVVAVEPDGFQGSVRKSDCHSDPGLAAVCRAALYSRGEWTTSRIAASDRVVQRSRGNGRDPRLYPSGAVYRRTRACGA